MRLKKMKSRQPASSGTDQASPPWVDKQIQLALKKPLDVRFYGRRRTAAVSPLVVHFHAGAFVGGSLEGGSCVAGLLAEAGAVVMSLDYPLAPAHPFPDAVEAGYAALVWAWKARHKLAGAGAPLFVAGEEAGGNLAAAVSLMARDLQEPALAGQILLSPMLDPCLGTASLRDAQAGPVGCTWADGWHHYLPRLEDASHPYAAPGSALRLAGLPPTLLITAQDDPLRDEALAYAGRLRTAGLVAHAAVLPVPTGWPCSYLNPASHKVAWAPVLHEQFTGFFSSAGAAQAGHTPISSVS
ncbi:alpha/beta hydrolase [Polaromonas jejuensis]|uniref:Alpha/beta hydrolase n=1 Tax=Polaromonas jejuensis TaxID=457502 RepID=A0ABW0Q5J1_9BURK|nr:alpha/beta hydrolase [Polaromonas jejuensis]